MLFAACPRLHSTSGGSIDTELKELAVRPTKLPSGSRVVITVTPVANWDKAWRKWSASNSGETLGEEGTILSRKLCNVSNYAEEKILW
jgi:hypothetical protein